MKTTAKRVALLILLFYITTGKAQQATVASSGIAAGSGGTATYSIGQVVYTTNTSPTRSLVQGVQQPVEISLVLGVEDNLISLNLQAYPNPTSNYLTLNISFLSSLSSESMNYQLFDITGKLIKNKKITSAAEIISLENLSSATYFLKVVNNNQELKTFKIIKN
jgi:hypothetical protein